MGVLRTAYGWLRARQRELGLATSIVIIVVVAGLLSTAAFMVRPVLLPDRIAVHMGVAPRDAEEPVEPLRGMVYVPDATNAVAAYFDRVGYDLWPIRQDGPPVPRIYTSSLPSDIHEMYDAQRRKSIFVRIMAPIVLSENERLLQQRARIQALRQAGTLGRDDAEWLAGMFERYKVEPGEFEALLHRVDIVPVSLALAQTIKETGWGVSRFAREGNALFGQWTWSEDEAGMVPAEREEGQVHRIRTFDSLREAVRGYMLNLNTLGSYAKLRDMRAGMRAAGQPIDGYALAGTLTRYSTQREQYVKSLRSLIRYNGLERLRGAELRAVAVDLLTPESGPQQGLLPAATLNAYGAGR